MVRKNKALGTSIGKFIFLGEHFVASGVPAIAFPLKDLKCFVEVSPSEFFNFTADVPEISKTDNVEMVKNYMSRAVYAASNVLRLDLSRQALRIDSSSNFPLSKGFGSSGAFAIALTRALIKYREAISNEKSTDEINNSEIENAVLAIEKIFHGSPSGVDTATIALEKEILFQNGNVTKILKPRGFECLLIDSGARNSCKEIIEDVKKIKEQENEKWSFYCKRLTKIVDEADNAILNEDLKKIALAIEENHQILSELNLSTRRIDELINLGKQFGALAGKVSGAGAGGAMFLMFEFGRADSAAQIFREMGISVLTKWSPQ